MFVPKSCSTLDGRPLLSVVLAGLLLAGCSVFANSSGVRNDDQATATSTTAPSTTSTAAPSTTATTAPSTTATTAPSTTATTSTTTAPESGFECDPPALRPDAPLVDGYRQLDVCGWEVFLNEDLFQDPLAAAVYGAFVEDLQQVIAVVPPEPARFLRATPIWFELDEPAFPGGVYHPSAVWLTDNGYPAKWARGIQFGNARNFLGWPAQQPAMLLHEFTHALHDQRFGFNQAEIQAEYERAMAAGLYESVEYVSGGFQRAYATTNSTEYLAELTEAYFWANDFYPFNREQLASHDPAGLAMVESVWGVG